MFLIYEIFFLQGNILREKHSTKPDWKHTVTKRMKETVQALKRHASKVSNQIRQWWRKTTTGSKKNSKPEL